MLYFITRERYSEEVLIAMLVGHTLASVNLVVLRRSGLRLYWRDAPSICYRKGRNYFSNVQGFWVKTCALIFWGI